MGVTLGVAQNPKALFKVLEFGLANLPAWNDKQT